MNLFKVGFIYLNIPVTSRHLISNNGNRTKNNDCALIPKKDLEGNKPIWPLKDW